MLFVYKSNYLNMLFSKASQIIKEKPLSNVFEKEIFIYDNQILFKYLNIWLAKKNGITANIKLYHADNFLWELLRKILFKTKIKNFFTDSIMMWKIIKILDKKTYDTKFINLNKSEKFKFSFLMAKIFKKYIFYRPNWINSWSQGVNISNIENDEIWQIKLWTLIISDMQKYNQSYNNFAHMFKSFNLLVKTKKINIDYLPHRFFVISSFSLNPAYINILKKISVYINIYFLHITPYKYNIFNTIENNKFLSKSKSQKQNYTNPLIQLWGKYEKIYEYYIIKSSHIKIINYFKKYHENNLLNYIKNDFLKKKYFYKNKKRLLNKTDNSISIHICYNKKNEIEILYKTLLALLDQNPSISPGDIIVTSKSIDSYTPYIYSTFTAINQKKQIPFFIVQNINKQTKIITESFKKILNLSNSRFENKEILEFLDIPEIANKFNISDEEIQILYYWIEETNIRWAIDEKHKNYLSFFPHKQNTWLYGIEKLLLSYSMNNTKNIWNNILSSSLIDKSKSELISKLIIFINTLKKWQKKLSKSQYIQYWSLLAHDIINDFFSYNENTIKFFNLIKRNWTKIIDDNISSNYSNKISINILTILFFNKFNNINHQGILPGAINFCHSNTVCYIPFKIICIIGADHYSVSQNYDLDNFNLLYKYSKIGDLNNYIKSCYLFLQSLSCAQKYFYISYVGYSIKNENNKLHTPSIIDQLLNYIASNFYFCGKKKLNIHDNTKNIIKNICKIHQKQNFYTVNTINASIKQKSQYIYKNIVEKINTQNLLDQKSTNKLSLQDIINFWKNPIRYFFKHRLNIQFNRSKHIIQTTEPFSVNPLDSYKIKNILLKKIIYHENIDELLQYYIASGKLPYGIFGKMFWEKSIEEMQGIAKLVIKLRNNTKEKKINLKIKKYQINGLLSEVQDIGLLRWKPGTINYSDRLVLWLEHLIYCVSGGIGESQIIGYKKKWSFSILNPDIAYFYLLKYIEGYIKGTKKIILLTKSGSSWLDVIYDIKNDIIKTDNLTKNKSHLKLLQTWIGNNFSLGEKNDFYIQKTFIELNEYNIKKICKTAQTWLIPTLKYKKK
ncbi:exodeoxyribonuclease V subunit gamma [Buchnera aphidicola]|uniref:RecBCD enzyme subunit RecC n=1 Tax=Buchnera aphidicola subsp. Uroleucon sonchi TaxID=118118 RepID=A0A6C1FH89_BUCUN|nr:exodeoxyribonuclease V subunit gamma [Buchnera aphidicola]QIE02142.1 exodeoxyribonuclease V subunit gamma [Buchnera aphidicola (Uroleucon sonchi)]